MSSHVFVQVTALVSRHIWALKHGLDQWEGAPEEGEGQEEEEEELGGAPETVQLNSATLTSKYTK